MKISWGEKVGYALGDTGANFFWKTIEFFLLVYYTDVFGLTPLQAGTMFLVARIVDAVADPLMGLVADRTRSRFGSFRPYLLYGAAPLGLFGVLTWTVPDLSGGARLVYAYVTYITLMVVYTIVNIPYSALMGVVSEDPDERTRLSSARFVGAFAAGLLVQFATLRLVDALGGGPVSAGGDAARGWSRTMMLYGALGAICTWICFFTTKERIAPARDERSSVGRDLKDLFSNPAWRVLAGLGVLIITNFTIRGATFAYYFKYNLAGAELFGISDTASLLGWFLTIGGACGLLGVVFTERVTRLFGKKNAYLVLMATGSLLSVPFVWLDASRIGWAFALNVVVNFVLGPTAPLLFSMYGDVADYAEWRNGRRATALVFAGAMFSLKLGGALGGFCAGFLLDFVGYVPNAVQSAGALFGIAGLVSWVPALIGAASLVLFLRYPLDGATMHRVTRELAERRRSREAVSMRDDAPGPIPRAELSVVESG